MMSLSININHDNLNEVPTGEPPISILSSTWPAKGGLQRFSRVYTNFYGHFVGRSSCGMIWRCVLDFVCHYRNIVGRRLAD